MAVQSSDLTAYLSNNAGTGGARSSSSITSGVPNNVWPDVSDVDRIAGGTLYRKTFFRNGNATDALASPSIYVSTAPTNMTMLLGLGFDSDDDADSGQGNMTAWSGAAKVALVSSGADTRVATIYGLDNSGTPVATSENVTLNGTSEVLSTATYSVVYGIVLNGLNGSNTVTVKQGTGGTTRGSIAANKKCCWLWVAATTKANGIRLPNLAASQSYGVWRKLSWVAGAGAVPLEAPVVTIEATA